MEHINDFATLCSTIKKDVKEVSIAEAKTLLASSNPPILIDVRDADEFAIEHLQHAQHISKGWIEAKIHTIVPKKETPVILYCGGGNRSALAAYNVQKMGYQNIMSMTGGFKAWKQAGYQIS